MNKKYIVKLTDDERTELEALISKGKVAAHKIKHAHILLQADANGAHWSDEQIAHTFRCHKNTVANIRELLVEEGLEAALNRKPQDKPSREKIFDGKKEAQLIALCCSNPPEGKSDWTLKLLGDRLVALEIVDSVSHETIRKTLKKTN